MPNKPVQAAAEGLPTVSRRKALGLLAAASLPTAIVSTDAVSAHALPELPVNKVHRLAEELALALDDWSKVARIQFSAMVYPASSGRGLYFPVESLTKHIQPHDPLLDAIEAYKDGNRRFCQLPNFANRDEEDGAIEATYGPPMRALIEWDMPAQTREGAIAALQITKDEGLFMDSFMEAMIDAVLGYLKGSSQA